MQGMRAGDHHAILARSESIVLLASLDRHGRPRGTIAMVLFTRANVRSSGALAPTGPDYTVF